MIDEEAIAFAWQHRDEDIAEFSLSKHLGKHRIAILQQLEGLHIARTKWGYLLDYPHFAYPPKLNCEQSSSSVTANYKAQLVGKSKSIVDLTGGMGVDTLSFSNVAERVDYVEFNTDLFELTKRNFAILGKKNIFCHNCDCTNWLNNHTQTFDIIYIDPARRNAFGKKMVGFSSCQPNILEIIDFLVERSNLVVIKASPMIDLKIATQQLGYATDIHIVAVNNECREILFLCRKKTEDNPLQIHCADIHFGAIHTISFTATGEQATTLLTANEVSQYLYEPNASIMKSGCFKQLSTQTGLPQLGRNSHLYTSTELLPNFPGRTFKVIAQSPLTVKAIKKQLPSMKAHVISRNYPIKATQLQQQLRIAEGGDSYVIATTVGKIKTGIIATRIN
ncbi:MAG: hypothetical protein IJ761_02445 [Bacteroidales bacterium]|nr:hypothetical protein [Bacteroidales bacterium]